MPLSTSAVVKRLYFDSDKAHDYLMIHQRIFTLRGQKPKTLPIEKVRLWGQGKALLPTAMKVLVGDYFDADLLPEGILAQYVEFSGFANVESWYGEALRLSGRQDEWSIFYVHLIGVF